MLRFFKAGDLHKAGRIREKAKNWLKINMRKKNNWKEEFGGNKDFIIEMFEAINELE